MAKRSNSTSGYRRPRSPRTPGLNIDGLGARLRDGVARAVGQTVAAAVQETVDHLLEEEAASFDADVRPRGWFDEDGLPNDRYDREPYMQSAYGPYEEERSPPPLRKKLGACRKPIRSGAGNWKLPRQAV